MPSTTPRCSPRADGERSFPGTLWSRKQCRETGARYTPVTRKLLETISDRNGAGAAVIAFLRASKIGRVGARGYAMGLAFRYQGFGAVGAGEGVLVPLFSGFSVGCYDAPFTYCVALLPPTDAPELCGPNWSPVCRRAFDGGRRRISCARTLRRILSPPLRRSSVRPSPEHSRRCAGGTAARP